MSALRKGTTVYSIIRAFYDHHQGRGRAVTVGELYAEVEAFAGTALHQRITDARARYGVKIVHERFQRDRDPAPADLYYLDPDAEVIEHARSLLDEAKPRPRRLRTTNAKPITPTNSASTPDPDGTEKCPASQPPAVPSESLSLHSWRCDRCGGIRMTCPCRMISDFVDEASAVDPPPESPFPIAGLDTAERRYTNLALRYVEGEAKTEVLGAALVTCPTCGQPDWRLRA